MSAHETRALLAALVLAAVHVWANRLPLLDRVPRSRWLSAFGGVAVAYVFVHLLPELAEGQEAVARHGGGVTRYLEDHVYLMSLAGLAVFYGVEQHSRSSRAGDDSGTTTTTGFWLSITSFAAYNLVVGYLLLRDDLADVEALALYTLALAVHFVVNDFALREHHRHRYDRAGRWIIAAAVPIGWVVGLAAKIPEHAIALVVAFIGGGVILNVLKEELPAERQARFAPFVAGAVTYAAVLQLV